MKYDAVVFDLLTALIDSWTLWSAVSCSEPDGMKWRRRYLEITYGCGVYRPYETLVREAAKDVGLPESLADELERRWLELQAWPEAAGVLKRMALPLAVATNCSIRLGRQAAAQVGVAFTVVESVGFYKSRPEVYRAVLQKTPHRAAQNAVRRGLGLRRARRQGGRHAGLLAQSHRSRAARRRKDRLSGSHARTAAKVGACNRGDQTWPKLPHSIRPSIASDRPTGSRISRSDRRST